MPKAEVGTPKWISTQWKKKGLNKLRWYCALCQTSCRDANGFQLHLAHENHLRREVEASERRKTQDTESRYQADAYSESFERAYLRYLVKSKLGQRTRAHEAYRAINPDDRAHAIMAQTCWGTLGRFIVDLRDRGEVEAWRDDDGWIVEVSEDSPAAAWADLDESEAAKMHSRLDGRQPVDWRDAKKRPRAGDVDHALERAAKVAAGTTAVTDVTPGALVRDRQKVSLGLTSTLKPSTLKPKPEKKTLWAVEGIVVRVRHTAVFSSSVKCRVTSVKNERHIAVESLDEQRLRAEVPLTSLETVVPKLGTCVRLLHPRSDAGDVAVLDAVHVDTFDADLTRSSDNVKLTHVPTNTSPR